MKAITLYNKYKSLFVNAKMNDRKILACFFGQASAEVGRSLKPKQESHRYTVRSARATFKTPFKGKSDDFIRMVLKDKEGFFSYVYANRFGNGSEQSGDGWKYSGKGIFQISLKNNYVELSKDTGIDFVNNPQLLLNEKYSLVSAIWFWNKRNLSKYARGLKNDLSNVKEVVDDISDLVNIGQRTKVIGDANGYKHRLEETIYFYNLFKDIE